MCCNNGLRRKVPGAYRLCHARSFIYIASVVFTLTLIVFGTSVDAFAPSKNVLQTVSARTYSKPSLFAPSKVRTTSTAFAAIEKTVVAEQVESVIAGKLKNKWYGIFKTAPIMATVKKAMTNTNFVTSEFVILAIVALGVKPLTKISYVKLRKRQFKGTILSAVSSWIGEFGKLGLIVYAFDVFRGILRNLGVKQYRANISREFAVVIYTIWAAHVVRSVKQYVLERRLGTAESGKGLILNKALNLFINTLAFLLVFGETIDAVATNAGLSMSSFRTLLGSGGIFAGLAAQQSVRKIISGTLFSFKDRFDAGDTVKLEDGTVARVQKVGILETCMLSTDGIELKVSNSDLAEQHKLLNLSRLENAHVVQSAKFRFRDVKGIDRLVQSIKREVKSSCPRLITEDDSYPFSVYWTNWGDKTNQIEVSCYLKIKPYGNEFMFAKQSFLEAVARGGNLDAEGYLNPPPPKSGAARR